MYSSGLKRLVLISGVFLLFSILFTGRVHASSFASAAATLTTSRPSPSSPLQANQAANDSSLVIADNKSFFLASDSARLFADTGQAESYVTIASMSASGVPIANQKTLYLATTTATTHHNGTTVATPITAMHTITFTTVTAIPAGGYVLLTYPGAANNTASPSASGFAFNNLNFSGTWTSANVKTNGITCNNSSTITSPTIKCFTTAGVSAGTAITFLIGCSAATGANCTTQAPALINPTKTASTGTADIWKVSIQTADSSNVILDSATIALGTVDSVTIRATIDPSLTFSIAGISAGGGVNNGNATGCLQSDTVNTGISATETEVPLGVLSSAPAVNTTVGNIGAQLLTVSTNGANGYTITATSSGHLINPSTGFFLNDSYTPTTFPASGHFFGLHACGLDADRLSTKWTSTSSDTNCNTRVTGSTGNLCKYGWPTSSTPIVIAQDQSGPVGNSILAGNGLTSISYAATQDVTLPPGQYLTVVTYVATPSF